jgi:hypothetical protein
MVNDDGCPATEGCLSHFNAEGVFDINRRWRMDIRRA